MSPAPSAAELLERARNGDQPALNDLVTILYSELRRSAARHLRYERADHTLQPTALVHEVYLKLVDASQRPFANEVHFRSVASRVMRQILVNYARARATKKRSHPDADRDDLTLATPAEPDSDGVQLEIVALHDALEELSREDDSLARLIEMRYFGGMTAEEIAGQLGQSVHVVRHDLRLAQAWLRRRLT